MIINDIDFNADLSQILDELVAQLRANDIQFIQKQKEGPDHIQITCPYHSNGMEHRPSAGIRKSDGMFHCFACGEVHTLPEVITHCFEHDEDVLGKFGWSWLLKNFATVQIEERKDVELDLKRSKSDIIKDNKYVTEKELDNYRYYHPYWKKRGIVNEDIIEIFDLGYDKTTNSITFPIRDINGNCLFVARRSVQTKFFSYPEGVKKPLYGLYELSELAKLHQHWENEIIVCESMIDCILLWQAGYYSVALNGLGNDLQFKQLRELPCRKLILATDNDEAGMKARIRIKAQVKNKLITEIIFPENIKDIGECDQKQLKHLLDWEVL